MLSLTLAPSSYKYVRPAIVTRLHPDWKRKEERLADRTSGHTQPPTHTLCISFVEKLLVSADHRKSSRSEVPLSGCEGARRGPLHHGNEEALRQRLSHGRERAHAHRGRVAGLLFKCQDRGKGKGNFEVPNSQFPEFFRARSRLYRSQILQVNTRWKALVEIYTMHSFAPFSNLKFFVKNR